MTRTLLVALLPLCAGVLGAIAWDRRPKAPDSYTVTAQEACLPPEGLQLGLKYTGTGVVAITVLPPKPEGKPSKEKKS